MQLWGGGFRETPTKAFRRFNDSFPFDWELLKEDIEGSIAWADSLQRAGVLSRTEAHKIIRGLSEIRGEYGSKVSKAGPYEDVHTFVEAALTQKIGALAGKLHTGRSRNDQVATDMKLCLKEALFSAHNKILDLALALAVRARQEAATPMPGYTHLKQAEPITFGHWCLAYVEMLLRDAGRFSDALKRADECPLGAGALAGTPVKVDRKSLAKALGFTRPMANSLDAVSDRDSAVEYLFAGGLLLVHLSRFGEDVILYSSDEFGFLNLPDSLATGSSRMPHKKNPDLLELVRGHAARSIGELGGLLALLKGLPLAYNKDLQLDKEPIFRLRRTLESALPLLGELVAKLTLNQDRMRQVASGENFLATRMADLLAAKGIPFRDAHAQVGRWFSKKNGWGNTLASRDFDSRTDGLKSKTFSVERILAKKQSLGGTAPVKVKKAAEAALRRIKILRRVV